MDWQRGKKEKWRACSCHTWKTLHNWQWREKRNWSGCFKFQLLFFTNGDHLAENVRKVALLPSKLQNCFWKCAFAAGRCSVAYLRLGQKNVFAASCSYPYFPLPQSKLHLFLGASCFVPWGRKSSNHLVVPGRNRMTARTVCCSFHYVQRQPPPPVQW